MTYDIESAVKFAVEKGLLTLVYQPIRHLQSGKISAVEALMRLRMRDGIEVPPQRFIPVAEENGEIIQLGYWAIRQACCKLLANADLPLVSVNVSPVQLREPRFADEVGAMLSEAGISGDRLALEITEGQKVEARSVELRCICRLQALGISIWLDDFGTGFAGLALLRLIDFDLVKIDRSFLHACSSRRGHVMLRNIVRLIQDHGPETLVEGIESASHLELARVLEVRHVQGFHIGRPA